jgi:hypothetical protein
MKSSSIIALLLQISTQFAYGNVKNIKKRGANQAETAKMNSSTKVERLDWT